MSRTYRRQKGDRPWAIHRAKESYIGNRFQWLNLTEEDFNDWKRKTQMDRAYDYSRTTLKWATNHHRRADKRMDLAKVYKATDYEDLDLYDRKRNYKKLIWIYL